MRLHVQSANSVMQMGYSSSTQLLSVHLLVFSLISMRNSLSTIQMESRLKIRSFQALKPLRINIQILRIKRLSQHFNRMGSKMETL